MFKFVVVLLLVCDLNEKEVLKKWRSMLNVKILGLIDVWLVIWEK